MQEIKACVHCIHLELNGAKYICKATEARSFKLDLVTGEYPQLGAHEMRAKADKCGAGAKLFQPLPQPVGATEAEANAIVAAFEPAGPSVGARVGNVALAVALLPVDGARLVGAYANAKWCGFKLGCATFGAKVRAAKQAWNSIADNTEAAPIPITAEPDPIAEAQAIQDGGAAVQHPEVLDKEPKPEDTQPEPKPEGDTGKPGDLPQTEGEADKPEGDKPTPVPLAKVSDPRQEAAFAQAVALGVAALLLGYIVAGLGTYSANHPGTLSSVLKLGDATAHTRRNCTECRKGEHCHPCLPPGERREASWQGVNPCKADKMAPRKGPRYQTATLH